MEGAEGTSRFYECRVTRRPSLSAVLISTEMDRRSERERERERAPRGARSWVSSFIAREKRERRKMSRRSLILIKSSASDAARHSSTIEFCVTRTATSPSPSLHGRAVNFSWPMLDGTSRHRIDRRHRKRSCAESMARGGGGRIAKVTRSLERDRGRSRREISASRAAHEFIERHKFNIYAGYEEW